MIRARHVVTALLSAPFTPASPCRNWRQFGITAGFSAAVVIRQLCVRCVCAVSKCCERHHSHSWLLAVHGSWLPHHTAACSRDPHAIASASASSELR